MSVRDESGAVKQFAAKPPYPMSKLMSRMVTKDARPNGYYYVAFAIAAVALYGGMYLADRTSGAWEHGPAVGVAAVVLVAFALLYFGWKVAGEIPISVANDGLTVRNRHGGVFSFSDATLGLWAYGDTTRTFGSALHLRSGRRHFVVGGRDHRFDVGTRLDEPPQSYVDAWLWAAEFDELIDLVGRRSQLNARRPGPGEPTHCRLYPNLELIHQMSTWSLGAKRRLVGAASKPLAALDIGPESISVIDTSDNAVFASAPRAQVTARPETYRCRRWRNGPPYKNPPPSPVLVLCIPGVEPMAIGCQEHTVGFVPRFSWRGDVPDRVNRPADYSVAAGDWLMLVAEFGLTESLHDGVHRTGH